jgi:hypothetical protein
LRLPKAVAKQQRAPVKLGSVAAARFAGAGLSEALPTLCGKVAVAMKLGK